MADKRIIDFPETTSPGADYFTVTDSASDGVRKLKPAVPATALPLVDGTAAVGTSLKYAREDHVHPTPTGFQPQDADLDALAALATTGIVRRTGAGTASAGTAVANSELATMANSTFKGNVSGSTATPSDLTAAQVTAALPVVTTSAKGLAPVLPNDATKYLDGTGAFSVPAGGGGMDPSLLRGFISGLTLSNDAVTPNTILDIAAGVATSDDATGIIKLTSGITKSTGGAWAAGSGSNGMGNGLTIAASTWYHVFLAANSGSPDAWFDTSSVGANRPTGITDTKKRRIGSFKTNASSQIIAFIQFGNDFLWAVPVNDYGVNNPGTSAITTTLTVPTGVSVRAQIYYYLQANDGVRRASLVTSMSQTATTPVPGTMSTIAAGLPAASGLTQTAMSIWTNTSGQIRHQLDGSAASTSVFILTNGWYDPL